MTKMLPPAQHAIAMMYAAGLPIPEIARRRGTRVDSAQTETTKVLRKLGVTTRDELAVELQSVSVGANWRQSTRGFVRGCAVRVTGGRYAGKSGVYVGGCNGQQVRVHVNAAVLLIDPKRLEML